MNEVEAEGGLAGPSGIVVSIFLLREEAKEGKRQIERKAERRKKVKKKSRGKKQKTSFQFFFFPHQLPPSFTSLDTCKSCSELRTGSADISFK